jgi:hypothetical protein
MKFLFVGGITTIPDPNPCKHFLKVQRIRNAVRYLLLNISKCVSNFLGVRLGLVRESAVTAGQKS